MIGGQRNLNPFLRFHRLVQAVLPVAVGHAAAGRIVDDDDFAVLHQVLLIAAEAEMGVNGALNMLVQLVHGV